MHQSPSQPSLKANVIAVAEAPRGWARAASEQPPELVGLEVLGLPDGPVLAAVGPPELGAPGGWHPNKLQVEAGLRVLRNGGKRDVLPAISTASVSVPRSLASSAGNSRSRSRSSSPHATVCSTRSQV
jgi:hypothetical protein